MTQSRDLREIASFRDPVYRAKSDILALNLDMDLSDSLTLTSQTAWNWDSVYSFQDYNRFNTVPIFSDPSNLVTGGIFDGIITPSEYQRSEEHTSELQSLMRISYAVFCLNKKKNQKSH